MFAGVVAEEEAPADDEASAKASKKKKKGKKKGKSSSPGLSDPPVPPSPHGKPLLYACPGLILEDHCLLELKANAGPFCCGDYKRSSQSAHTF